MEFSFTIGTQEYTVPKVVTTELFQKAIAWDIEDEKNHKPFVSVMANCPLHQINLLDTDTFNVVFAVCVSRLNFEDTELRHNIGGFQLLNFSSMTFGQFVDIDMLIADGMTKHVVELTHKLYGMPEDNAAKKDIRDTWKALIAVSEFRTSVYQEYDEFFDLSNQDQQDDITVSIDAIQLMWYNAILVLAEQKFLNIQYVTERPYKEALNFLTWKKNEIAKEQLQQLKRKNDIQRRTR